MTYQDDYRQLEQARDSAVIELQMLTDGDLRLRRISELRDEIALATAKLDESEGDE